MLEPFLILFIILCSGYLLKTGIQKIKELNTKGEKQIVFLKKAEEGKLFLAEEDPQEIQDLLSTYLVSIDKEGKVTLTEKGERFLSFIKNIEKIIGEEI